MERRTDDATGAWDYPELPKGQPKATWYDRYGRSRVLPADPYSLDHYRSQGLRLNPPESPVPFVEDESATATRQVMPSEPPVEQDAGAVSSDVQMLLARIEQLERKRGPDKKKRKRRRKRTPS